MNNLYISIIFLIGLFGGIGQSQAQERIIFGPKEAKITGSIPYSVMGTYRAQFSSFNGKIILDETRQRIESVDLEIQVGSIQSNCPWCDRAVRSRRLLNAARYPKIIFKSDEIIHDKDSYHVKGVLQMHGIKRRMLFPFKLGIMVDPNTHQKWLEIKGDWVIDRKIFNITWNKFLDHGGLLVGDYFTVNWGIKEPIH